MKAVIRESYSGTWLASRQRNCKTKKVHIICQHRTQKPIYHTYLQKAKPKTWQPAKYLVLTKTAVNKHKTNRPFFFFTRRCMTEVTALEKTYIH